MAKFDYKLVSDVLDLAVMKFYDQFGYYRAYSPLRPRIYVPEYIITSLQRFYRDTYNISQNEFVEGETKFKDFTIFYNFENSIVICVHQGIEFYKNRPYMKMTNFLSDQPNFDFNPIN